MVSSGGSRRRRALVMVAAVVATPAIIVETARAHRSMTSAQAAATESTAASRDARWREFPVFIWFAGGPPQGPRPFATLKAAGLAGCNIEAAWDAADSAAARGAGIDFYVDHLAGKGDLWLRPAVFDRDRDAWKDDRLHFRPQRPTSLVEAATRARLLALVDAGLERHRGATPLCWVLDDELSITRGVNPLDYCFAPETLRVFRKWLEARYGSIDAQNRACGTTWPRFDDVVPPTTGEVRAAADGVKLEDLQFAGWNDHREFMEVALRELLVALAAPVAQPRANPHLVTLVPDTSHRDESICRRLRAASHLAPAARRGGIAGQPHAHQLTGTQRDGQRPQGLGRPRCLGDASQLLAQCDHPECGEIVRFPGQVTRRSDRLPPAGRNHLLQPRLQSAQSRRQIIQRRPGRHHRCHHRYRPPLGV